MSYDYTRPIEDPILRQAGICMYKMGYITKFSTAVKSEQPYIVLESSQYDASNGGYGDTAELNPFIDTLAARRQLDVLHDYMVEHQHVLWDEALHDKDMVKETQHLTMMARVTRCLEELT